MDQEPEGGLIRRLFSTALQYLVGEYDGSQRDMAKEIGCSPSSLSDYIHARREGTEDTRRRIAAVLGIPYHRMLGIGLILEAGHRPRDWEFLAFDIGGDDCADVYRSVRTPADSPTEDLLIVRSVLKGIEIKRGAPKDSLTPYRRSVYIKQYSSPAAGLFDARVLPEDYLAFRAQWAAQHGGADQLVAFIAQDDLSAPKVMTGDIIVVKNKQGAGLISGKIYAVQLPGDPTVYMRTLVRIGAEVSIPQLGVQLPLEDLNIIGRVVWVGREL